MLFVVNKWTVPNRPWEHAYKVEGTNTYIVRNKGSYKNRWSLHEERSGKCLKVSRTRKNLLCWLSARPSTAQQEGVVYDPAILEMIQ